MALESSDFDLFVDDFIRVELIRGRFKSAVFQLIIFLSSACLCDGGLLSFELLLEFLGKRLPFMGCVFGLDVLVLLFGDDLWFECAFGFLLGFGFLDQLLFLRLAFEVLMPVIAC